MISASISRLLAAKYFSIRVFADITGLLLSGIVTAIAAFPVGIFVYLLRPFLVETTFLYAASAWAVTLAGGYIVFGVSLLVAVVALRKALFLRSKEGVFAVNSAETLRFALFHGLLNVAQIFFLRMIRGTSLVNAFYRGMGATIGKRTLINTVLISDCDLITIGDDCLIGGDVVINGHSAEHGDAIRERVVIGNRVTIGQYSTILPGVQIEDDVIVGANSLVPKFRHLRAGRTYIGVPARYSGTSKSAGENTSVFIAQRPAPSTDSVAADGFIIDRSKLNIQQILLESYKMRHAEVLDIIRFMSQVTVASLGLLVTILIYSLINHEPRILLFLPPLSGLTYAIVLNSSIAMQRLGMKASEIEIMFSHARVAGFDWEMKYGAMGSARVVDLDAVMIQLIFLVILIGGTVVTWRGDIMVSAGSFWGVKEQHILVAVDLFICIWLAVSATYLLVRQRAMRASLKRFAAKYPISQLH